MKDEQKNSHPETVEIDHHVGSYYERVGVGKHYDLENERPTWHEKMKNWQNLVEYEIHMLG